MFWKYHIPHKWESSDERNIWEDIYLMPDLKHTEVEREVSVWLTVDASGNTPLAEDKKGWKLYRKDKEKLKTCDYIIDQKTCNMKVKAEDFNLKELLEYARLFIEEVFNDNRAILVEGTIEEFLGTNEHISFLEELGNVIPKPKKKGEK